MASLLSMKGVSFAVDVTFMKEAIAIMQHHDAVTGTEKQHVAEDYARLVHQGVTECEKTQTSYYQYIETTTIYFNDLYSLNVYYQGMSFL